MLEVKDIQIRFKYSVIENAHLEIHPYEITLLTGKSGTGKTSLLNVLGLLDQQSQYSYIYDNCVISGKEMDAFKRYSISYVFQDYNLIEDMSIQDNFKTMFNIVGMKYNKKLMMELLDEVSIDLSKIKSKGKSLSGGEKQRVAIALALVKHPKLLLLDEPTANLDEISENQIISILQNLKDKGMMIVVATHHPDIYPAQHIYNIENQQVTDIKHESNTLTVTHSKQKHRRFNPFAYALSHISSHIIIYAILLLIMSGTMYNVEKSFMRAHQSTLVTNKYVNSISENEIVLINNKDLMDENEGLYYFDFTKKINPQIVEDVSKINNVEKIYPYYKDTSPSRCDKNGNDTDFQKDVYLHNVYYNDKIANVFETYGELFQVTSCDAEYKEKQCDKIDESVTNGVFISSRLAKLLGISKLHQTEIRFYMPIFMGYHHSEGYAANPDGTQVTDTMPTYPNNILLKEMTYKVQGIYEESADSSRFYDMYDHTDLYVDYHEIGRLHNEAVSDKATKEMFQEYLDYNFLKDHNSQFTLETSMYIVRVDDSDKLETVTKEIEKLGYDINIKTKSLELDFIDDMTNDFYYTILMLPLIILGVVSILIVVLYTYTLHQRKKELSFLKANGIKNSFLLPIVDLMIIITISVPITTILSIIHDEYEGGYNPYDFTCFIVNVIAVVLILGMCFIANKLYYRHTDMTQELRSK